MIDIIFGTNFIVIGLLVCFNLVHLSVELNRTFSEYRSVYKLMILVNIAALMFIICASVYAFSKVF